MSEIKKRKGKMTAETMLREDVRRKGDWAAGRRHVRVRNRGGSGR